MEDREYDQPDESVWPSVELAHEFVAPSYDWIQRRFESVERRIQTFLALTATLTLGVPALVIAIEKSAEFGSIWFITAMVAAALNLILGIAAMVICNYLGIWFLSPDPLYEDWLHYDEFEFKRNAIYWAGEHFNSSAALVVRMGWMLTGMLFLFSVEVVLLLVWLAVSLT